MNPASYIESRRALVDKALDDMLPKPDNNPSILHEAVRKSVFAGGKRLRPILAMAAGETVGSSAEDMLPLAVSLECVHTYSLIHDDLPAMDDDDLRRGEPTLHKVYGEAIAVLAGDALQAFSFQVLSTGRAARIYSPGRLVWAIGELATAAGPYRLVAGQAMDILSEGKDATVEDAAYIMVNKTGALIRACLTCAGILSGAEVELVEELGRLGDDLGTAYQIKDDLLDLEGDSEKMGKAVGKDQHRGKVTYAKALGKSEAARRMNNLMESATERARTIRSNDNPLVGLCEYISNRIN